MSGHNPPIRPLRTQRASPLSGTFALPGDSRIAQCALVVAAMARGESRLTNLPQSAGVEAMARAVQALGARIEAEGDAVVVSGLGIGGLLEPEGPIDASELGDGAALLFGATGIYPFETRFAGVGRPSGAVPEALAELGIRIEWNAERPGPLTFRGPLTPVPGSYRAATEETKNALLLAALTIPGVSSIVERQASLEHAERALTAFGAELVIEQAGDGSRSITMNGHPDLRGRELVIPGDPSWAAIALTAGLIVPGSQITIENVLLNPRRAALLGVLKEMGAGLTITEQSTSAGEPVGTIRAKHSPLTGISVPASIARSVAEEMPFLVLVASFARGDTVIEAVNDTNDVSSWLAALTEGLSANGVRWVHTDDRLTIEGQGRVTGGGVVHYHPDPRIALVFLMMGMASRDSIAIADETPIASRFPGALDALATLGARFRREVL